MTAVFDAAAIIAWFNEEPAAAEVDELLANDDGLVSCVNLAEVVDWLSRKGGVGANDVVSVVEGLVGDGLVLMPCGKALGLRAGALRASHYKKKVMEVSLADCVAAATAELAEATLVTSDARLVDLAEAIGIEVQPIPNSLGVRPELSRRRR